MTNSFITVSAPHRPVKVFLAGSIEMGNASKWQTQLTLQVINGGKPFIVLNPRRDDWDSSWEQDPSAGTEFSEQVDWELDMIDDSDVVFFYFDPNTKSPISLLELGYVVAKNKPLYVVCPEDFYRYGNVIKTLERSKAKFKVHTTALPSHIAYVVGEYEKSLTH